MMKSSFWLSTLFLICALAFGPAAAGPGGQVAHAAYGNGALCDDFGAVAGTGQTSDVGFVLAQVRTEREPASRTQTVAPQMAPATSAAPAAGNTMQAPGQSVAEIPSGDCCGPVLGGCVSWCNKPGGCTGKGDCDTFKAN